MTHLELAEWTQSDVPLTASQAAALQATGAVQTQSLTADIWRLTTGSTVGVISIPGLEVRIVPKITIAHLLFLLGYATEDGWTADPIHVGDISDLVEAIASSFTIHAHNAVRPGLLQGYTRVDESAVAVRGRIRFGDQLARHQGQPIPLEISYDEFTSDIAENRMLRAAGDLLLRLPYVSAKNRRALRHLRGLLSDVTPIPPASRPRTTRLNQRYHAALTLAELILNSRVFAQKTGSRTATTFLFDMNRVYENFLSTALVRAFARHGGTVRLQHHSYLDTANTISVIPDISWWVNGTCRAVIDAKYKDVQDQAARISDVYQMLAYCTTHKLARGTLVYAAATDKLQSHTIRNLRVQIDVRAVNLDQPPRPLLADVQQLAGEFVREAT